MRELERESHATEAVTKAPLPPFAILGAGRVGGSLAAAARAAGLEATLVARGEESALADLPAVLLCVPDDAIASACALVAERSQATLVGHTSGATGLEALEACRAAGADVFSLHPLQTVPDATTDLTGAPCAITASGAAAEAFAAELANRLGMRPFALAEEHRAAYHAAASIASNFLVALEESAAELLSRAGIDDARDLLSPLVLRSAANWSERGADALTGPIARGDEATVRRHREALAAAAPELVPLYDALAERARTVAGGRRDAR